MTTPTGENVAVETRLAVLETQMEVVQDGQRQIIARLDAMQRSNDAKFDALQQKSDAQFNITTNRYDALNGRIDRLFYTILGLGVAAIGTLIALEKFL